MLGLSAVSDIKLLPKVYLYLLISMLVLILVHAIGNSLPRAI